MRNDLHRHLSGSIRPEVVQYLLKKQGDDISLDDIRKSMTFTDKEYGFHNFLSKFKIFNNITWKAETIHYVISQICWDIARESLDYVELKFSVDKYLQFGLSQEEVVDIIYHTIQEMSSKWGIKVALVLSLKYEADRDLQKRISKLVDNRTDYLAGIDLVGDEAFFDKDFYLGLLKDWLSAGKGVEAHVGESCGCENVMSAIEFGVHRIAHGIRVVDDKNVMQLAKDKNICFDIALTSNLCTGVVGNLKEHPVKEMLDFGCDITIGTDDPTILNTTLDDEYRLLLDVVGVDEDTVLSIMGNSVKYAFQN
jgi:adenosine deaminase